MVVWVEERSPGDCVRDSSEGSPDGVAGHMTVMSAVVLIEAWPRALRTTEMSVPWPIMMEAVVGRASWTRTLLIHAIQQSETVLAVLGPRYPGRPVAAGAHAPL